MTTERTAEMTTETTTSLPPCPLPDCGGGEHHFHDIDIYEPNEGHSCAREARIGYRCYGPHRPRWQSLWRDQIKAGMRIRATIVFGDLVTTHIGVAHHADKDGDWRTEGDKLLTGWYNPTTYEVDSSTIPDPEDAREVIAAVRAHGQSSS